MILEPLHVIIKLAMIEFYPIGTKLTIADNTVHIQQPTVLQGVTRWYQSDRQEDLYYLFEAIRRYYDWYHISKNSSDIKYTYLLSLATRGIKRLMETYRNNDKKSIFRMLKVYHNMLQLNKPELFKDVEKPDTSIDSVFCKIQSIYNDKLVSSVINIFQVMEIKGTSERELVTYMSGLDTILTPVTVKIQNWIREKLTC